MTFRRSVWGTCVALLVVVGVPSGPAHAGERDAVADAVARVMDAANTRMKAVMEEARLLEAAGQRDRALALLQTVPAIYDDATKTVRALVGGPDARPAAPRFGAARAPVAVAPTPRPPAIPPRTAPDVDPVAPAVAFLLGCQRPDGAFDPRLGSVAGDPADAAVPEDVVLAHTTGAVLLALLDVSGPRVDANAALGRSIVRAADALLERSDPRDPGRLPTLAVWALATAVSRTGEARWLPAVRRGVDVVLDGLAPTLGTDFPSRLPELALEAAFLHEVAALPIDGALRGRIAAALDRLRADALGLARTQLSRPVERVARDLLVRGGASDATRAGARDESFSASDAALGKDGDALEVLLGTTYAKAAYGFDDGAEGRAWWDDVLVPTMNRQARTGPARGSWSPPASARGVAGGRVATTALLLLAWKVPTTPWIDPVRATPTADDAPDDEDEGR